MGIVWKSEEVFIQEIANKIKSDMKGKNLLYNLTVDMSLVMGFKHRLFGLKMIFSDDIISGDVFNTNRNKRG